MIYPPHTPQVDVWWVTNHLSKCDFMVVVGRNDDFCYHLETSETHPDLVIINVM